MCFGKHFQKIILKKSGLTGVLNSLATHLFCKLCSNYSKKTAGLLDRKGTKKMKKIQKNYHRIITLPQVNPLPKAAKTTKSPFLIFPCSQASVNAIGMDAAVVFPNF